MKKVKLFPAPHIELRVMVSDQMIADYKKCAEMAKEPGTFGADCDKCSWEELSIGDTGMCELIDADKLI